MQIPVELRFDIARYRVDGNTLLPAEEVDRIVSAYAGKGRDFGDVQRALEALQEAYRVRGYSAVQVYLPEQELARGEVLLKVVEARIAKLDVQGNKFFDEANIRRSLPALAAGSYPNANAVAKNLRLANENPAKQTNVTLRAGAKEGEVDARVDVVDENPSKWFLTLDNTGTPQTGYHRFGVGYRSKSRRKSGSTAWAITFRSTPTAPRWTSWRGTRTWTQARPPPPRARSPSAAAAASSVRATTGTSITMRAMTTR